MYSCTVFQYVCMCSLSALFLRSLSSLVIHAEVSRCIVAAFQFGNVTNLHPSLNSSRPPVQVQSTRKRYSLSPSSTSSTSTSSSSSSSTSSASSSISQSTLKTIRPKKRHKLTNSTNGSHRLMSQNAYDKQCHLPDILGMQIG
jgi:hypothetical protein